MGISITHVTKHRLYFDESGTHASARLETIQERYLALCGVIFEEENYFAFQTQWESMKRNYFGGDPDEPIILHRKELMAKSGLFSVLADTARNASFEAELLRLVSGATFTSLIVVIDKAGHNRQYANPINPYSYCLLALLQRYCFWLGSRTGDVMGEARGKKEDRQLMSAYTGLYEVGDYHSPASFFRNHLTSKHIKLCPKPKNVAGLQLADLLAHPAKLRCILNHAPGARVQESPFGRRVADVFWQKLRRRPTGDTKGWGEVYI